jgi:NADH dehydrogenase [ubiquinone] 1 alpha subcomplex assembly factor 7
VSGSDLATTFRRLIRTHGPMPVSRFMGESNARYYATRDPLGAPGASLGGDFVTAPEISQMFGELAGLWLADLWDRAGRPGDACYAELGPGRGTLAKDALRAMARAGLKPPVHLVEGSPALRAIQAKAVPGAAFHEDATTLPDAGPLLLIGNEFLDALPIRQLVRTESGWRERMVALDGENFVFVAGPQPMAAPVPAALADAEPGTIVETGPAAAAITGELAQRLVRQGGAALVIDYGHLEPRTGSTLQAVRAHRHIDALAMPGEADLTAHVDFAPLAGLARTAGCTVHTATQGDWLRAMGIDVRAAALARATPAAARDVAAARDRLVSDGQMGQLFKVMAIVAPGWPPPSGFAPTER